MSAVVYHSAALPYAGAPLVSQPATPAVKAAPVSTTARLSEAMEAAAMPAFNTMGTSSPNGTFPPSLLEQPAKAARANMDMIMCFILFDFTNYWISALPEAVFQSATVAVSSIPACPKVSVIS